MSTASSVAAHKEAHPELYCRTKRCLWFTGRGKACLQHPAPYIVRARAIANAYNRLAEAERRYDLEEEL